MTQEEEHMLRKKSTRLYRVLLKDAWRSTWNRKHLWIFGIFAAIISTGGVVDVAFHGLKRMKSGGTFLEKFMDSSFIGYDLFGSYVSQLNILGQTRITAIAVVAILVVILLIIMSVVSQAALLLGVRSKRKHKPHELKQKGWKYFWDIFFVDFFTKFFTGLLTVLVTLPLFLFYIQTTVYNELLYMVTSVIFFAGIIVINIISILAIIDIIEKKDGASQAIVNAWRLFRKQWVATVEYAVLQFFVVMLAGFVLIALIALLSIPYAIIYSISLLSGSFLVFLIANILFALFIALIILGFSGAVVTFQYHAWYLFYKRAMHKAHGLKNMAKIMRWLRR